MDAVAITIFKSFFNKITVLFCNSILFDLSFFESSLGGGGLNNCPGVCRVGSLAFDEIYLQSLNSVLQRWNTIGRC